jgi:hypothetical protein
VEVRRRGAGEPRSRTWRSCRCSPGRWPRLRVDLVARLASVFDGDDVHQAEAAMGVTTDDLLAAVEKAVAAAWG